MRNIVRKAVKIIKIPFVANNYLSLVERQIMRKKFSCTEPQLFITGLPRSGTTLIYQYIVHRLNLAYFTHGVGKFHSAACCITYMQHKLYGQYSSDFKSNYGKVSGPVSPREAGGWWNQFFDINNYVNLSDLSDKKIYTMRNTIACVQCIYGNVPFVNKNVKHLLRIVTLSKIFPNSKFLIVTRDMSDVAISILRGRYKNLANPMEWWSVRPHNYNKLKSLPVIEQVANQCISLKEQLENDLMKLSPDRIIRINYEEFCNNPEELIKKIKGLLRAKQTKNLPQQYFEVSHSTPKNNEEQNLITLLGKINNV